jgi:hypothetical protein
MTAHQNILVTELFNVFQCLDNSSTIFLRDDFERINAPSYLTTRIVVIPTVDSSILTFGDEFICLDESAVKANV